LFLSSSSPFSFLFSLPLLVFFVLFFVVFNQTRSSGLPLSQRLASTVPSSPALLCLSLCVAFLEMPEFVDLLFSKLNLLSSTSLAPPRGSVLCSPASQQPIATSHAPFQPPRASQCMPPPLFRPLLLFSSCFVEFLYFFLMYFLLYFALVLCQ